MQHLQNPLRRARLRRGLSLDEVGARTPLSPRILRLLDEGRFGELPGGVYARSHVRAYASAVDLDPDQTVDELSAELPVARDPFPTMLAIARAGDPAWLTAVEDASTRAGAWVDATTARLRARVRARERLCAAAIDGSILVALQALLTVPTAWICGIPVQSLLTSAGPPLAAVWGLHVSVFLFVASRVRPLRRGVILRIPRIRLAGALSFTVHQSRHA